MCVRAWVDPNLRGENTCDYIEVWLHLKHGWHTRAPTQTEGVRTYMTRPYTFVYVVGGGVFSMDAQGVDGDVGAGGAAHPEYAAHKTGETWK